MISTKIGKKCGPVLFPAMLAVGLVGCGDKDKPGATAAPAEKQVTEAELTARLQREINETRAAIAEAAHTQDKLATEIEVLQQLLKETETELTAHEEEVSRLEAQRRP